LVAISKRFGDVVAVNEANFSLRPGTVHALLGENGAGKTSLMRIAFGMLSPDAGSLRIDGAAVRFHAPSDAVALGIGMVQQHFSLIPAFTAVENFALGGRGAFNREKETHRLQHYAALLGLSVSAEARPSSLSAAEQQQLEIAKALGRECRILILDEPYGRASSRSSRGTAHLGSFVRTAGSQCRAGHAQYSRRSCDRR
jgi:simple sugar transport system ATP-binding protein